MNLKTVAMAVESVIGHVPVPLHINPITVCKALDSHPVTITTAFETIHTTEFQVRMPYAADYIKKLKEAR